MKNGKRFCVCFLAGLLAAGCVVFTGCEDFRTEKDFKDFGIYRYLEFDDHVSIVDLTEEGKLETILDIPAFINGKPVGYFCYTGYNQNFHLISENVVSLYLPFTFKEKQITFYKFKSLQNLYLPFTDCRELGLGNFGFPESIKKIYIPQGQMGNYQSALEKHKPSLLPIMLEAPVTYMLNNSDYNYTKNECYRVDSATEGELLNAPPIPYIGGYTFTGWFYEPECRSQWLFEQDKFENEPVVLYAGWRKNE